MLIVLCFATDVSAPAVMDASLREARSAFDAATKLEEAGRYAEALRHAQHALVSSEAVLGGSHPEVARCLNLVGEIHRRQGLFPQAESFIQRGLAIREAAFGQHHPDVASSLNALAEVYAWQSRVDLAAPLFERALAIREQALGENHPDVAASLVGVAKCAPARRAEALSRRALAIWEATRGKDHPDVARALLTLASRLEDERRFQEVYGLNERALAILEAALGKDHPRVALPLMALGRLNRMRGYFDRAEEFFRRALTLVEASHGQDHLFVTTILHYLAGVYMEQDAYARAEPLLLRELAIWEASGRDSYREEQLIRISRLLGRIYMAQGLYHRAESLLRGALSGEESGHGKNTTRVAALHHTLGVHYRDEGLYQRAEPHLQRALIAAEAWPESQHVAEVINDFALLRLAQHRLSEALPLFTRAFTMSEAHLRKAGLASMSSLLQRLHEDLDRLNSLLREHPHDAGVKRLALTAALLLKGRTVEESAITSRFIHHRLRAGLDRDTFQRLRDLRAELAELSLQGPGKLGPSDYETRLTELETRGAALELDLMQVTARVRADASLPIPDDIVARVAAGIPKDGALVELIAYNYRPLVPRPGTPASRVPSQLRYLALVLFPDGNTRAVDLGPAEPIDSAASRLHDALGARDVAYDGPSQRLHQLVFRPLLPLLGDVRRLFVAPDGQLALIPLAALHDGQRFLVETFDFTYLTTGKELLPRPEDLPVASSVVVLADPDFGTAPTPRASPSREMELRAERSPAVQRFFSTLRSELTNQPWAPLPGTRKEAEALRRLIPDAQVFLGPEVSKERLLGLAAPGILHIATHGFFLQDAAAPVGSRGVVAFGPVGGAADDRRRPIDPWLRSGLVLAGARAPATGEDGSSAHRPEDTLVTAMELAFLDLWGTQLVVLSACDTGRGDVRLGQGVYGLRRALVVAGAETVVLSLWKVNDETTRTLMELYYRNLLAGMGRSAALREAMLSLRQTHPHPSFWAPFIALGRDTPLRGMGPSAVIVSR